MPWGSHPIFSAAPFSGCGHVAFRGAHTDRNGSFGRVDISGIVASIAGSAGTGVVAVINRKRIADFFAKRVLIVQRLHQLEDQNTMLRDTLDLADKTSAFTREEAAALIRRVESLEKYVPKFNAAIEYIKLLFSHINMLETWAQRQGLAVPAPMPPVPPELVDDLH